MPRKRLILIAGVLLAGAVAFLFRAALWEAVLEVQALLADRERSRAFLAGLGWLAPVAYAALQTLQVVIAPVPGEATGFIGGYLFGTFWASVYSTAALTLGSWINVLVGRYLGRRWIRRLMSPDVLARMDALLRHQGAVVVFILFVFPGFPKDSLCLFLGMSALPVKVTVLLSAVGRIPGTIMLSAQGASLYDRDYDMLAVLTAACVVMIVAVWYFRAPLYRWIEKQNNTAL